MPDIVNFKGSNLHQKKIEEVAPSWTDQYEKYTSTY